MITGLNKQSKVNPFMPEATSQLISVEMHNNHAFRSRTPKNVNHSYKYFSVMNLLKRRIWAHNCLNYFEVAQAHQYTVNNYRTKIEGQRLTNPL